MIDLTLTGTGPAAGFPVRDCPCAVCARARPSSARRPSGLTLPDGTGLDVHCAVRAPDGSVHRPANDRPRQIGSIRFEALGSGSAMDSAGAAAQALLVRIDGEPPLLWAPQGGRLGDDVLRALTGIELGWVFLGPSGEDDPTRPLAQSAPSIECGFGLARLRLCGAVMAGTVCALIGIGHREPQPDRLALCLAAWQAWAPDDGASSPPAGPTGPTGRGGPAGPEPYRRRLVLGGSGSGKSALAEDVLAASPGVVYVATGPLPDPSTPDPDWSRRVDRHRDRRPPWWRTIETQDVAALLRTVEEPLLIDSLGTWLTGVLDRAGAWSGDPGWPDEVAAEVEDLLMAWRTRRGIAVAVSDEVGWGVVPATSAGRLFRDELGRLNRRLADESEAVHLVAVGRLVPLPPGPP